MSSRRPSTSDHLKSYSVAKAEFIRDYLSIYLNILEVAKGRRKVYVLDLMCGEGLYRDGKKGTAVHIAEAVREHHFSRKSKNTIRVVLNDPGESEVEPGRLKIDRVRDAIAPIVQALESSPISFDLSHEAARDRVARHLEETEAKAKRLFVIDPKGYSQFEIRKVQSLTRREGTEVFLFLPIPEMYRFARSVDPEHPLGQIVNWLWQGKPLAIASQKDFATQLIDRIRGAFGSEVYVTPVYLSKSKSDRYVLAHFTQSLLGLEKVIEVLHNMDPGRGEGFGPGSGQIDFMKATEFESALLNFILAKPEGRTNREVAVFALTRQRKTKQADAILRSAKKRGAVECVDTDTGESLNSFYLPSRSQKKRSVIIRKAVAEG